MDLARFYGGFMHFLMKRWYMQVLVVVITGLALLLSLKLKPGMQMFPGSKDQEISITLEARWV